MEALIKAEDLKIEDKEIDEKIEKFASDSSQTVEEFKKSLHKEQIDYIVNSIMNEKLLSFLVKENTATKKATKKAASEETAENGEAEVKAEGKKPAAKKTTKKAAKPATDAE